MILNLSNLITFIRFLLGIPIFYFLLINNTFYAVLSFIAFLVLDIADGWVARRLHQETDFGDTFDYIADISIGAIIFFTLVFTDKVPVLIWALALANYVMMGILVLLGFVRQGLVHHSKKKNQEAFAIFSLLFLLILNTYNTFTLILIYLLLAYMYYLTIHYFYEITEKFLK